MENTDQSPQNLESTPPTTDEKINKSPWLIIVIFLILLTIVAVMFFTRSQRPESAMTSATPTTIPTQTVIEEKGTEEITAEISPSPTIPNSPTVTPTKTPSPTSTGPGGLQESYQYTQTDDFPTPPVKLKAVFAKNRDLFTYLSLLY